jgi:excisionase family DNA binding protein
MRLFTDLFIETSGLRSVLNILLQSRSWYSKQSNHPIARSGDLESRPFQLGVNMKLADSLEKRTTALTVSDVAEVLHVSGRQVYSLAASNKIPHMRVGGAIRFDPSEFAAWLRQKMITTVASSTSRINEKRKPAVERSTPTVAPSCETLPKIEATSRFRSRRKLSSKNKAAAQQQYRFAFGHSGSLPPGSAGKEDTNREQMRTGSIGTR